LRSRELHAPADRCLSREKLVPPAAETLAWRPLTSTFRCSRSLRRQRLGLDGAQGIRVALLHGLDVGVDGHLHLPLGRLVRVGGFLPVVLLLLLLRLLVGGRLRLGGLRRRRGSSDGRFILDP
jgi:hypothetical protein